MAIISTRINELPLVQDPTQFEIPGFNIQTNAGGKARMSDLVGPTGPSPNVSIVAHSIPNGQNPTVTKGGTNLNPTYDFGIPVAADGRTPELRVSDGYIQYRYGTDPWVNLK